LVKRVNYFSVGTVEFIVDSKKNFFFLEMNTRLQVEHPVTEYVTGLDLVEQMLLVAAGEKLKFKQSDIKLNGWAIESRIYAEDPSRGFLPSSGRIAEYIEPETSANVRVDSGVFEGGQVSMFYDVMIAKLITYGKNRQEALENMQSALGKYVIRGISHNISFLEAVMGHAHFASGDITTRFIEDEYPDGFFGAEVTSQTTKTFLCVGMHVFLEDVYRAASITGQLPGRRRMVSNKWIVNVGKDSFTIYVKPKENGYNLRHESDEMTVRSSWILGNRLFHGEVDGILVDVQIEYAPGGFYLTHAGAKVKMSVRSPRVAELDKFMPEPSIIKDLSKVEAPISGVIVEIKVKEGDDIKNGQELFILEAMKMENIICAEKDAKVSKVNFGAGDNIAYGDVVIEYA
jgi:propionyl-CoA carboxylase alpha chain